MSGSARVGPVYRNSGCVLRVRSKPITYNFTDQSIVPSQRIIGTSRKSETKQWAA